MTCTKSGTGSVTWDIESLYAYTPLCVYFRAIRHYDNLKLVALWICSRLLASAVAVMRVASTPVIKL